MIRVFISAGETSGDRLGAHFMARFERAAHSRGFDVVWTGQGGPSMGALARGSLEDMAAVQSAGLFELLPKAPAILLGFRRLLRGIERNGADLAVLVDFPDFNLRLAPRIKKRGTPLLYYVAPQLWAWRPGRVSMLRRNVDALAVLFPFEENWFRKRGVNAFFAGHPLVDSIPDRGPTTGRGGPFGLGLFPGSRGHEVNEILPVQLEAARDLCRLKNAFVSVKIHPAPGRLEQIGNIQRKVGTSFPLAAPGDTPDLALCAAGTVTLELALMGTPFVLTHRVNRLSYEIAKLFVNSEYLAMPHVLLDEAATPELIQRACTKENILKEVLVFVNNPELLSRVRRRYNEIRHIMGAAEKRREVEDIAWELVNEFHPVDEKT